MTVSHSDTKSPNWSVRLCWMGALLPVCLAFVAQVRGQQPGAAPEQRSIPGLSFSQYLVNERDTEFKPFYEAFFRFRNTGDKTVQVTDLKPSCGCLNPKLEQRVYAPQESGEFTIRIDPTKEKPGPHEYYVDVHYNDPEPRVARVTYKVNLPDRKIEISPKALIFYQLSENGPEIPPQEFIISDYRDRHLNITGIESTSPLARAELTGKSEDESGNLHVRFNVIVAGNIPPGTSRVIINLTTDDPRFKVLQVPILIRGPEPKVSASEMPLQSDPKSVVLNSDKPGPVAGKITLKEIAPNPLTIKKVQLVSAEGTVKVGELRPSSNGPLERFRDISFVINYPPDTPELKALLVIETDSPEQPRLEIPIVVENNPFRR